MTPMNWKDYFVVELCEAVQNGASQSDVMHLLDHYEQHQKPTEQVEAGPVAKVKINKKGGNAGIAWRGVPLPDAPLMRDGELLYASPPAPVVPNVDELAQFIRKADGDHSMGAGKLAEHIVGWLSAAQEQPAPVPNQDLHAAAKIEEALRYARGKNRAYGYDETLLGDIELFAAALRREAVSTQERSNER